MSDGGKIKYGKCLLATGERSLLFTEKLFKRNFKWPSMQRWQCPIYNGTFYLIKFELELPCLLSLVFSQQKWLAHFLLSLNNGEIIRINTFGISKMTLSSTFWLDLKGIVVNRELASLHGGSLKITFTVPLNILIYDNMMNCLILALKCIFLYLCNLSVYIFVIF